MNNILLWPNPTLGDNDLPASGSGKRVKIFQFLNGMTDRKTDAGNRID